MASAYMFSHYFPGDGVESEQPAAVSGSSYPHWFDGSFVGMFYPALSRANKKAIVGYLSRLYRRYLPERLFLLVKVIRLLFSPDFAHARSVVRSIARNPASRSMKFWTETQVALTRDPNVAENVWRGTLASFELASRSSLPRPEQRALLELAWLAAKERRLNG